jgi:outer membrane biosynthesis protein TonB
VNVEAQIKIQTVVLPDGSVKAVQPLQKGNTKLEEVAMKELRFWRFEPLRRPQPQIEQTCIVTFLFRLK